MSRFPPIDPALFRCEPDQLPCERNFTREMLEYISELDGSHQFAHSWGYAVFRTCYGTPGADENFARAVRILNIYAWDWALEELKPPGRFAITRRPALDPRPAREIKDRLCNVVVEDRATLENATVEEVGRQFDLWVANNNGISGLEELRDYNPRFRYCIMLDKESINNILTLPENPDELLGSRIYSYNVWTKVVMNEQRDGQRLWLRVGVCGLLWGHWFEDLDPEFNLEEHEGPFNSEGMIDLFGSPFGKSLVLDDPSRPPVSPGGTARRGLLPRA